MRNIFISLTFVFIFAVTGSAQQGTAEPGYYPPGYAGSTWTGVVTSANEVSREFTLTYKKGDKEKTFVGVLPEGYTVKMKDGTDNPVKVTDLMGMRLKAYFIAKTKKNNGEKAKTNEVFKILFLPKEK